MNSCLRIAALFTAVFLLVACQKTETQPSPASTLAPPQSVEAPATDTPTLRLIDPSGAILLTFKPRDLEVALGSGDKARTLQAKTRDDGKRKYTRLGEGEMLEVKAGDDGFKLRNMESRLLWKLKLKDNGIKISDNEENARPITLKRKDGRIEISDDGKPLGEVSFDGDKSRAKVTDAGGKDVATVQTTRNSAAFALLLATRIPESERAVLALELLARDL